jgi:hypothetical protein
MIFAMVIDLNAAERNMIQVFIMDAIKNLKDVDFIVI